LLEEVKSSRIMTEVMNIQVLMNIHAHSILRSLDAARDVPEIRPDSFFLAQEEDQKNVVPDATEAIR
jgi:hypothetical protein